jgi:hypothetical protein
MRTALRAEVRRFGEFPLSQGHITPAQPKAGLARQREPAALGGHTIGQTLVAMGAITSEQRDLDGPQQVKQAKARWKKVTARTAARDQAHQGPTVRRAIAGRGQ